MGRVVQVNCPGCRKALRVPADWLSQPIRCTQCGAVIKVKPKSQPSPAAVPPSPAPGLALEAAGSPLVFESGATSFRVPAKVRRPSVLRRCVNFAALAAFLVAAGVAIALALPHLREAVAGLKTTTKAQSKTNKSVDGAATTSGDFPRRLLAVSVNNYLYANPINYGRQQADGKTDDGKKGNKFQGRNIHTLVERLARSFHIPEGQVVELSDAAPGSLARPPFKAVIASTITQFLEASRAQDRIVLLFVGHAVELDDVPYLAPLEGNLADKETLIPFSWLYEQLEHCKARQKLLVFDVCRYDPGRGFERPGSGDLGPKLDAALQDPPDGVQVWTACAAGQRSYEFDNAWIDNGLFLEEIFKAVGSDQRFKINLGVQKPEDPLPLDELVKAVNQRTEKAALDEQKLIQTPRLTGTEKPSDAPFDPNEPLLEKLAIEIPALPEGAAAAEQDFIRAILRETADAIPPVRIGHDNGDLLKPANLPLFPAARLAAYKADYTNLKSLERTLEIDKDKYPLRRAMLHVAAALRQQVENKNNFMTELRGTGPEVKRKVLDDQRTPAKVHLQLTEALEELKEAGKVRDQEPSKRWQANYDYALARLLNRLAYYFEYNLMLGRIRKDELPELGPNHKGWRLSSREKVNAKEAREFAAEAKKALDRLIKDHPGTPWEVLAKREKLTALGMEWQATSFGE